MLTAQAPEQILQDKIISILTEYRDEQVLLDPLVDFNIYADRLRGLSSSDLPAVVVSLDGVQPVVAGSSAQRNAAFSATFNLEIYCANAEQADTRHGAASEMRLKYLYQQIRTALFRVSNYGLQLPVGTIARRPALGFERFRMDKTQNERQLVGGVCRLELIYNVDYEPAEGDDFVGVGVDTELFKYDYTVT